MVDNLSKFAGHSTVKTMISGGAIQVTVSVNPTTISSQPCRMCYVIAGSYTVPNTGNPKVNIGASATSALGIRVPALTTAVSIAGGQNAPLMFPVDNLNKLSFWTKKLADMDKVDVMWLR